MLSLERLSPFNLMTVSNGIQATCEDLVCTMSTTQAYSASRKDSALCYRDWIQACD